jgi:formyltetrahydrofolate-dependent phosphoribosylglycinamide formyltransferase
MGSMSKPMQGDPIRMAILISGGGTTMVNLAEQVRAGRLPVRIVLVASSRPDAAGLAKAAQLGLPTAVVNRKEFDTVEKFSDAMWKKVRESGAEIVALAGFLSLLKIPADFDHRVLNIHPALLPKFGGKGMYGRHVHEAVLAAGEKESGCTVHFADNEYDHGRVILQRRCPVLPGDTAETLAARVFEQECIAYPEAIRRVAEDLRHPSRHARHHQQQQQQQQ